MARKRKPGPPDEAIVQPEPEPESTPVATPEPEVAVSLESALGLQDQEDRRRATDDPWELLNLCRELDLEDRAEHLERWTNLVAKKTPAEQDALVDQSREVFKVRVQTLRDILKGKVKELVGERQVMVTVQWENWLAETVYRKGGAPPVGYLVQNLEKPDEPPVFQDSVKVGEQEYIPPSSMLADSGTILFAESVEEYEDDWVLFQRLKGFVGEYLQLDNSHFQELLVCYILMSWVYDRFDALPYLRAQGDMGSGKTRLLTVVGSLSYRALMAGGATTSSPVFRIIDRFKGTLVIDEADFDKTEMWSEIVKVLNCGYTRGWPVLRTEKNGDGFDVKAYDCFSPKILATRRRFSDAALESRCLSHTMPIVTEFKDSMPLTLGREFRQKAQQLRNMLMCWRLRRWITVDVDPRARVQGVEPRINQIVQPLLAAVESPKLKAAILSTVIGYNQTMKEERRESMEGLVAATAVKRWIARQRPARFKMDEITSTLKMQDLPNVTPRKIGDILRRVLSVPTQITGGDTWVIMTEEAANKLINRYALAQDDAAIIAPPVGGQS